MNSFYSRDELKQIGFKSIGNNVMISKNASFYSPQKISLADNVRIDDFCILSGTINLGNYVHISSHCAFFSGKAEICIDDFSGTSTRTTIYATSDDFSGEFLINPLIPDNLRNVYNSNVEIKKHVQIGANCIVLPGVTINEGVAVGAMSLVNKTLAAWGIYAGIPCKFIKERKKKLLSLERELYENL